ncbi:MAG TPA: tetratricopeptide repeat protein [Verrucomicrobiae bacterium]|nr:tetratricopeptide repeat protein [Verrucomicrobiae bacterium]
MQRGILAAACALVIGIYAYAARTGYVLSARLDAANDYYNLLVQGFRAGQLNLKYPVPPGLAQLADPYDPVAHSHLGVLDMSYYRGKLYLYFGVTPAVMIFWPYVALTGRYLSQRDAAVICCIVGFLTSVGLMCGIWRRYFAGVSVGVVAAGAVALGLVTLTPSLLARCDVWEVPISCGYAMTMLALAGIWKALHEPEDRKRSGWLAAASLAYGLALGARPSLLLGAVIMLAPVALAWRERRTVMAPLLAAITPIVLIGLGLMLYNALRFDNPFEFGMRYILSGDRRATPQPFSPRYLWFNVRVFFWEPARWSGRFPFVHEIAVPPLPAGYASVERPFGILTNVPVVWLALAVPLAWRGRSDESCSILRVFVMTVAVFFGISALTLCLFCAAASRYEFEFLPALALLAVMGMFGVERVLWDRPAWRRAARWGWSLLLLFSVAFNLLASVERCGEAHFNLGFALAQTGQAQEAIGHYEQALRLKPDFAEAHFNLGNVLFQAGKAPEAIDHYEQALRLKPDFAEAHFNLGDALFQAGKVQEAIDHYEQALRFKPDFVKAQRNLGNALLRVGNVQRAIGCYEQALRMRPNDAATHYNLGLALEQSGRAQDATEQFEEALRLTPDFAEAQFNLGNALVEDGRAEEATAHWEEALRLKPGFVGAHEAHYDLGVALERGGRVQEAIKQYEQALRIAPEFAAAHFNLGLALAETGRAQEAIEHWEEALQLKPDFAEAHYNLGVALEKLGCRAEAIEHYEQALRIKPDYAEAQSSLARARSAP